MAIDKKKLREQYKQSKPPMGCFSLLCDATDTMYIGWATNLESAKNSLLFRLSIGGMLNEPEVQQAYTKYGGEHFSFSVLEELPYDKDDEGKDYKDDLSVLTEFYLEKYPEAKEIQVWKYPQH
ncbi:MAG TPA: GIY-YIG nuclease family protein [Sphaerochaeta sp.]|nr:GIY-YIG nuclease family protein [Sphaerochaeta sp.]